MNHIEIFNASSPTFEHDIQHWNMVSDQVMGGKSSGQAFATESGLKLLGEVSLANNGGFLQIQRPIEKKHHPEKFTGIYIKVRCAQVQTFDLLLKSSQLWMPWQSYRATIEVGTDWQLFKIPFSQFKPYRTQTNLNPRRITKFSILAGGRVMQVDLDICEFGLYQ